MSLQDQIVATRQQIEVICEAIRDRYMDLMQRNALSKLEYLQADLKCKQAHIDTLQAKIARGDDNANLGSPPNP